MRVAYVCADDGVPIFGHKGCSVHVQEMVRALERQGARVDVFAARANGECSPGLERIPVRCLSPLRDGEPVTHAAAVAALNREIAGALDGAGPFDLVYERYSLWSFAAMEYARTTETPGFIEVNAPLIEEQARYRGLQDAAGAADSAARAFAAASALLAVSDEVGEWLTRFPMVEERLHILPNGVDPDRFGPDVAPIDPAPPGIFTVGFVGSMKPWHGVVVLVDGFAGLHARVAATRLLLVGGGPEEGTIRKVLADRGLESASRFVGPVPPHEVPAYLTSLDAAVAPYSDGARFYFSPLKVYEYLAAGRAVVASEVGQLRSVIQDEVNGLLVPPGDPAALAAALERLQSDPRLRASLGRRARESVLRSHTWDGVAAHVLHLARTAPQRAPAPARA